MRPEPVYIKEVINSIIIDTKSYDLQVLDKISYLICNTLINNINKGGMIKSGVVCSINQLCNQNEMGGAVESAEKSHDVVVYFVIVCRGQMIVNNKQQLIVR